MNFKEVEEEIKQYYSRVRALEQLNYQLEILNKRKESLEDTIENSNIFLFEEFSEVSGVSYDGVGGSGGVITSPQERAIDKAFVGLEKKLEKVKIEILLIKEEINDIQVENSKMEYILKDMKKEYIDILEFLFKYEKTTLQTSMNCNMDKSTVSRKKDKVVKEVMKWLKFYN